MSHETRNENELPHDTDGFCHNCGGLRPLRYGDSNDTATGAAFYDIVCNDCHGIVATLSGRSPRSLFGVLFAVEQAVKNGCAHWEIEDAFCEYERAQSTPQP